MSDVEQLILILVAFYVFECLVAVRRDAFWFWSPGWGGYRAVGGAGLPGAPERGLTLALPVPPLTAGFFAQFWPFSLSQEGISARRAQHVGSEATTADAPRFAPWSALGPVTQDETRLVLAKDWSISCSCATAARRFAAVIESARVAPVAARAALIQTHVRRDLDRARGARALRVARGRGRNLHIACNVLCVYALAVGPWIMWRYGLAGTWPALLGILVILWVATVIEFNRAHWRLMPKARAERRKRTFIAAATPIGAIRAYDALMREQLAEFSPLTLASMFCNADRCNEFARRVLADLRHPCHGATRDGVDARGTATINKTDGDTPGEGVARWLRGVVLAETQRMLNAAGADLGALLAPPVAEDVACAAYCPRCDSQYREGTATCPHCPGVALVPFVERSAALAAGETEPS